LIPAGTRLGPYDIVSHLGAGGMGEVYRARDTRLRREVAIKVLPPELAGDEDRRQRFEQEARSASALSHPAIVTVYDVGSSDGRFFIAMEMVEGETLREMLVRGAMPVRRALDIAGQVADGLAKAHAAGIVHRDLKPENVMVSADGYVKILDFGLAKLVEAPSPDGSLMPTSAGTAPGVVMGTVGYMSPEQASARPVDFRSDQFSFGSILYEMLSGRRAFARDSGAETLAAILRDEPPPLATESPATPVPVRWIVERCLAKDSRERYASTSDLARDLKLLREHLTELSGSGAAAAVAEAKPRSRPGWWAVAAAFLVGAALAALWSPRRPKIQPAAAPLIRPLTYTGRDYSPAVSPDGKTIAFVSDRDGKKRIWLKQIAGGGEQVLTDGPDDYPRFSPDGSMFLFVRTTAGLPTSLWRQSLVGGELRRIVENAVFADWSPDGKQILFLRWELQGQQAVTGVWTVSPDGSGLRQIHKIPDQLNWPRFSPDGRRVAAANISQGGSPAAIYLFDPDGKESPRAVASETGAISSPAWSGNEELIYSRVLSASGTVVGAAGQVVARDLRSGKSETLLHVASTGYSMDVLSDGRLVFDTASSAENLREIALTGSKPGEARWLTHGRATDRQPCYSPDGQWVVFSSNRSGNLDLWEVSTSTGSLRRLTDDAAEDWDPGFTPDGKKLLWSSNRSGPFEIWIADADGANARQLSRDGADAENPTSSPDGQWIFYNSGHPKKRGLWKIRSDGSQASQILPGRINVPDVSPDGRYVAYASPVDATLKVVRSEDGKVVLSTSVAPSFLFAPRQQGVLGRPRWLPGSRGVAFVGRDENGVNGVYAQNFTPETDTTRTRRRLGGFDTESITESLGLSADGTRLAVASVEPVFGIVIAENVPGIHKAP
jgi:Tol biopolymer transport system component